MNIIGAGLAGLLAGRMLGGGAKIVERQNQLPNSHKALLRFRSDVVSNATGIPFKKVKVMKEIEPCGMTMVKDAMTYSKKVLGSYSMRSLISCQDQLVDRYIAPPDLVSRLAEGQNIDYNTSFDYRRCGATISTIPMLELAHKLGYKDFDNSQFRYKKIWVVTATLPDTDFYGTIYIPDPDVPEYRASITGDRLIVELSSEYHISGEPSAAVKIAGRCLHRFGWVGENYFDARISLQEYGKIEPIDEHERKKFLMWATDKHGIFSLGRFATWRPGLLMDDLVKDMQKIIRMHANGIVPDQYKTRLEE